MRPITKRLVARPLGAAKNLVRLVARQAPRKRVAVKEGDEASTSTLYNVV